MKESFNNEWIFLYSFIIIKLLTEKWMYITFGAEKCNSNILTSKITIKWVVHVKSERD